MPTLADAIAETEKNGRVCLQPLKWNELWVKLPSRTRRGANWEPPPPLILAAWWETPVLSKKLRFREHLEWADKHGAMNEIYDFIIHLREDQWYHGE
jgi:hypothetical protein